MPTTMKLIAKNVLGADATTITFSSIPQTFDDLVMVLSPRASVSGWPGMLMRFNTDTGSNYSYRIIEGSGASASSFSGTSTTSIIAANLGGAGTTANTFGNIEIYVPNYTSSAYKPVSSTSVSETNATTAYIDAIAGLWSSTAAITQIDVLPSTGYFVTNSSFFLYGITRSDDNTPGTFGIQATGGDVTISGGYKYHVFKSSGTFTVTEPGFAEVLMVAGGGAGGAYNGSAGCGGGGAGGVQLINTLLNKGPLVVGVGAGGTGSTGSANGSGSNTFVANLSQSIGGGFGSSGTIGFGGSSGGADGGAGIFATSAVAGQGNKGGDSPALNSGGGGGGAGGVGGSGSSSGGGAGGVGTSAYSSWGAATNTGHNVSGTRFFAGGGGGSWGNNNSSGNGLGGNGGGGNANKPSTAGSGMANTGGGGGASSTLGIGGSGGSGIVIIRYPVA